MAQIGGLTLSSEMNTFYSRLNTIRKNHSLNILSNKFVQYTPTLSNEMTTLKTNLDNTASSSRYIPTRTFDLKEIGIGDPTKYETFAAITSALDYMESVCVHDNDDRSDYSDRSDDSDDSHDRSDYSQDRSDYNDRSHDANDNSHDAKCSYDLAQ